MATEAGKKRGRRPGASVTRQKVLDAARACFAREGYAAATIRKIAGEAGVDAALVMQFFGSKEELFAAVMSISPEALARFGAAFDGSAEGIGERVTRAYLDLWEGDPADSEPLLAMLRSAITNERAAEQLREFVQARLWDASGDKASVVRAGIASTMLIGVVLGRRVIRVPALVAEDRESIVAAVAPAIQVVLAPTTGS
ncbi:TetR/AcrR family transcriptional regulator [Paractinoplanes atraurantiacus]|uniref:DNA-binding transcriptional regulator, AcrR family n=1 Tax=Paractinoplanes atraurantiacus TaxID=1036182 RepID=A0A285HMY3_9ACTN|nr:TetR family transcriptional regulator [Actinoplanes atraurantiacus]SNY37108.1 DNA-binding transcriptional regulator, AcrR family [Actinoplanes atraurantiacus]